MSDVSQYSPASQYPGASSHVELHGPAHGSEHNSNGITMNGPPTDYPVESHAGPGNWGETSPDNNNVSSW